LIDHCVAEITGVIRTLYYNVPATLRTLRIYKVNNELFFNPMLPLGKAFKPATPSLEPSHQFANATTNKVQHAALGLGADSRVVTSSGAKGAEVLVLTQAKPLDNGKTSGLTLNTYTNPQKISPTLGRVQYIFSDVGLDSLEKTKVACDTTDFLRASRSDLGIRIQEFDKSRNKIITGGNYYAHCLDFENANREAFNREKDF